jgi:hypothetical protein
MFSIITKMGNNLVDLIVSLNSMHLNVPESRNMLHG